MSSDPARDAAAADEPVAGEPVADQPDTGDRATAEAHASEHEAHADEERGTEEHSDEEAGDGAEAVGAERNGRGRAPKLVLFSSAALALAAFIVAAVFGSLWLVSATGDRAELASARNAVTESARNAVQAVTEVDYQNPDQFFERSKAVSTQEFGKQLTKAEDSLRKALAQAKTKVETSVMDVAVQELNDRKGTATFLAVVSTDITQGDRSATKVLRLQGKMERVSAGGQEWKLAGLSEVPVVGSGAAAPNAGAGAQQGAGQGTGPGK